MTIDIFIKDHGSVVQFVPNSEAGREWLDQNCDWPEWNTSYVADHRPARDIILGILNDTDLITN